MLGHGLLFQIQPISIYMFEEVMKEMQRREIPEVSSKNVEVNWLLVFQSIYTERCTTTICILEQNFHFIMK